MNISKWLGIPFILAILVATSLGSKVYAITPTATIQDVQSFQKVEAVSNVNYAIPLLMRACSCESWGDPNKIPRQFLPNGKVVTGVPNPNDVGACQINLTTWGKTANKLGLNVTSSLHDNIEMANYIYSVQGMSAWKYSENCWEK